jgi:MFS family permease
MEKGRLLVYLSIFTIMGLSNAVIPILPELAGLGSGNHAVELSSFLFSAYFIGALLTMLPFGILAERYGFMRFVTISLLLTFFSGIIMLFTNEIYLLILARLMEGTACGAFFPAAFSYLGSFSERKQYMGEFNFLLNAGLAAGVALSGFLATMGLKYGIMAFTVMSLLTLIAGIGYLYKNGRDKEKLQSPIITEIRQKVSTTSGFLVNRSYMGIWIIVFVLIGTNGVLLALYPDYSTGMLSKAELGIAIAVSYISTMISSIWVSHTSMESKQMINMGIVVAASGTLATIWLPFVGFALLGSGSGLAMVGLPTLLASMSKNKGITMGLYSTYTYGGLAIMPIFAGALSGFVGMEIIFAIFAILLFMTLFVNYKIRSNKTYIG